MGAYSQFPVPRDGIQRVLELGSRDCHDAIHLRDHFDADVVAWECNPPSIERCHETLRINGDRIRLVEAAAWDSEGHIDFHPVINGNYGASSCLLSNHEYPYEKPYQQALVRVPAKRVDDDCQDNNWWPDLMCIDLQGVEGVALRGCPMVLGRASHLITEVQHKAMYTDATSLDDITSLLEPYGFRLQRVLDVNEWFGDVWFAKTI